MTQIFINFITLFFRSYGITLWEVFSLGRIPYPGKANEEVMEFVKNGGNLPKPDICPHDM